MAKSTSKPATDLDEAVRRGVDLASRLVASIESSVAGKKQDKFTVDMTQKSLKALASILAEARAREKLHLRQSRDLTPSLVLDWARSQPESVRKHLLREIKETLHEGSVLSS